MKVAFFDAKPYDKVGFDSYTAGTDISIKYFETHLNEDTVSLAVGYDCVCVFVNDIVNKAVVDQLYEQGVKMIALRCAGFNNVDTKACFGKIHVFRVPAYSPYVVAEHAMALLLTASRHIHKAYNRTRDFNFSLQGLTGFDLNGKTVGIIGTGKIGKVFANICRGFGMNILASDPYPDLTAGYNYVSQEELFAQSDIISLHCPLTEETKHLINEKSIAMMKKGVTLVNTSRGGLIDTEALEMMAGAEAEVAAVFAITKAAALAYLMFNLFTPPCFAALGAMRSELSDRKWFWGGVALQFATGFTVSFLVYQIGTLVTTGSFGAGFVPGLIAVAVFALVIFLQIRKTDKELQTV